MFWKKKKNSENSEYFLKIGLTESDKLNIYIGWPVITDDQIIMTRLTVLLNGIMTGTFNETIDDTLRKFENPLLNTALDNVLKPKHNYVSPLDVV
jgi:hypothetical protein